jgi:hypothetical protein
MSKKILVVDEIEEEIQYVSTIEDNKIDLRRSKASHWNNSAQGENIGNLIDHGNGIKIKMEAIKLTLDYSQFCELYALMDLKMKYDANLVNPVTYIEVEGEE